jgi:hypothetical protein
LFHPAPTAAASSVVGDPQAAGAKAASSYSYRIAIPRDAVLKLHIASKDLRLGDNVGATLPGNVSQQAFKHATGDANPRSFVFTVLGLLP